MIIDDSVTCGVFDTSIKLIVEIGEFEENFESVKTALMDGASADGEI